MMRAPAALVLAALVSAAPTARQAAAPIAADFVELDTVVVDGKGQTIHGLGLQDFTVKEDGKAVTIETFTEVSGPVPGDPDSARTVVLLLDDTGISPGGTVAVQAIARAFVSSASRIDELPVVRLHAKNDEPFGDRISGDARIAEYRGGAFPFVYWSTTGELLDRIAETSRLIAGNTGTRKVIVCIGSPYICNVQQPLYTAPRSFEGSWTAALSEAAKANVAVYALIPGRASLRGGGVPEFTGGDVLASSYDMGPSIDRILQDASNYYVLGYWPPVSAGSRGLHRVEVKVKRRGAKVLARRLR